MTSAGPDAGKTEFSQLSKCLRLVAEKECRRERRKSACGFTLVELLIVLVILVSILAIAWPQMRRRIARSQLKQVATDFVEDLAEAQRLAVESGQSLVLQFKESSNRYEIWPRSSLELNENNSAGTKRQIEQIAVGQSAQSDLNSDQQKVDQIGISRTLDPSLAMVLFIEPNEEERSAGGGAIETISIGNTEESETDLQTNNVVLTSDGRSDDAQIAFHDLQNRVGITVRIRGLTGRASIGDFYVLNVTLEDASQNSRDSNTNDQDLTLDVNE